MGAILSKASTFIMGPDGRYKLVWSLTRPLVLAALVAGAIHFFSDGTWSWPEQKFFKETFTWEGPCLLFIGAIAQALLASLRSTTESSNPTTGTPRRVPSATTLDHLDVGGWGFVAIGALLSWLAAVL